MFYFELDTELEPLVELTDFLKLEISNDTDVKLASFNY